MNSLMQFEGNKVEILEINGDVYFNPYDVGRCLELGSSAVRMAISKMNEKQCVLLKNSGVKDVDSRKFNNFGENFLTESGVYKLIFKSNKPKAEEFANWVTDEVLPSIRKTGSYIADSQPTNHCTYNNRPVVTIRQIAEHLGINVHTAQNRFMLHKKEFTYGTEYEILYGCTMEQFKAQNAGFNSISKLTVFTPKGARKMLELCKLCQPINAALVKKKLPPQNKHDSKQEIMSKMCDCVKPIGYILDFIRHSENEEEKLCYAKTLQNFTALIFSKSVEFEMELAKRIN